MLPLGAELFGRQISVLSKFISQPGGGVSMNSEVLKDLSIKAQIYSQAYVRNLVVAEKAVLAGQFNVAKVLRAAAHSQRVLAMNAARLTSDSDATKVFEVIIHELGA